MGFTESLLQSAISQGLSRKQQEEKRKVAAAEKLQSNKEAWLSNPDLLDMRIAGFLKSQHPLTQIPRAKGEYPSRRAKLEASIPEGHPYKEMGDELYDEVMMGLQDPRLAGLSREQITAAAFASKLNETGPKGMTRLERAYRFKESEDERWFGDGKWIKKPVGYDEWKEQKRVAMPGHRGDEDDNKAALPFLPGTLGELTSKEWFDPMEYLTEVAAIGAIGGFASAATGGAAAPGALALTGLTIVGAPLAHVARSVLHRQKFYEQAGTGTRIALDLASDVASYGVASPFVKTGSLKTILDATGKRQTVVASPGAMNIIESYTATKAAEKVAGKAKTELSEALLKKGGRAGEGVGPAPLGSAPGPHPPVPSKKYFINHFYKDDPHTGFTLQDSFFSLKNTNRKFKALKEPEAINKALDHKELRVGVAEAFEEQKFVQSTKSQETLDKLYERTKKHYESTGEKMMRPAGVTVKQAKERAIRNITETNGALLEQKAAEIDTIAVEKSMKLSGGKVAEGKEPTFLTKLADTDKEFKVLKDKVAGGTATPQELKVYNAVKNDLTRQQLASDSLNTPIGDMLIGNIVRYTPEELEMRSMLSYMSEAPGEATSAAVQAIKGRENLIRSAVKKIANDRNLRMAGFKSALAAFGVGTGIFALFANPDEVHAGFFSSVPEAAMKLGKSLAELGIKVPSKVPGELLHANNFQKGLVGGAGNVMRGGAKTIFDLTAKRSKAKWTTWISPAKAWELAEKSTGKTVSQRMTNPAVFLASFEAAVSNNVEYGLRAFKTLWDGYGIKSASKVAAKELEQLTGLAASTFKHDYHYSNFLKLSKQFNLLRNKKVTPGKAEQLFELSNKIASEKAGYEKYAEAVGQYHAEYNRVIAPIARDNPSVRVALALDDTAEFSKYPFLKDMITYNDRAVVGKTRHNLDQYKVRLEELKVPTIKGSYFPYMQHPKISAAIKKDFLKDYANDGIAFTKFYSRNLNSRPLVPDAVSSLDRYVYDTEKRIQTKTFWDDMSSGTSWRHVSREMERRGFTAFSNALENLKKGSEPVDWTFTNKAAEAYTMLEVGRLLSFSTSAGFKHGLKATASLVTAGYGRNLKSIPAVTGYVLRKSLDMKRIGGVLKEMGFERNAQQTVVDDLVDTFIASRRFRHFVVDTGMELPEKTWKIYKGLFHAVGDIGGVFINLAELGDRALTIMSSVQMAAKQGMTAQQSYYGTMETIIRNNFLTGALNPSVFRNPVFKSLFLFQGTVSKIWERRLTHAIRTGRTLKAFGKVWNENKLPALLDDIKTTVKYVATGENKLKETLFGNAMMQETDFWGTPMLSLFLKEAFVTAGIIYGANKFFHTNLLNHMMHLPFVHSAPGNGGLEYPLSPAPKAAAEMIGEGAASLMGKEKNWYFLPGSKEYYDQDFMLSEFLQRTLKGTGPMPAFIKKASRISNGDIPLVYQDLSPKLTNPEILRYLLAAPYTE